MDGLSKVDIGEREVDLRIEDGHRIHGDRVFLHRIIVNLLSNISRYTPDDCKIQFGFSSEEGWDVFWISDSGDGVSDELLPQMFDPFVRGEESRSKVTGGIGLGLMLVRQVAEAHGGSVKAENRDGLRITLRLPARPS
jgi:signal transduction histidine kinase